MGGCKCACGREDVRVLKEEGVRALLSFFSFTEMLACTNRSPELPM